jgi:hypothetical protein
MKVKIGKYRSQWTSQVHYNYMNKKYDHRWEEKNTHFELLLQKLEDALQWIYNHSINLILGSLSDQKKKIHIDHWDTWSMDHTLAPIILPMLVQLRATKNTAPMVDMKDVPKELRATKKQLDAYNKNGDADPKHFERWDWILDEMIWAFEQKCRDDWMEDYDYNKWDSNGVKAHQERMSNGFRLFGKYYENLWD